MISKSLKEEMIFLLFSLLILKLSFVNQPANKGKKRASANKYDQFSTGISNLDTSTKRNTSEGKINGSNRC